MRYQSVQKPDKSCCNKAGRICKQILEPVLETSEPLETFYCREACACVCGVQRGVGVVCVCGYGCFIVWVTLQECGHFHMLVPGPTQ